MSRMHEAPAAATPSACSCHPDDNPPRPCPRKHAYGECLAAHWIPIAEKYVAENAAESGADEIIRALLQIFLCWPHAGHAAARASLKMDESGLLTQIETMQRIASARERQFAECREQRAELVAALREAREWRPIETAPNDGTPILGTWLSQDGERGIAVCWWAGGWMEYSRPLTHWMPLPDATALTAQERGHG
jgi:hypothetical protein